jgi:tetratricopeptide (TPR) repeat protein
MGIRKLVNILFVITVILLAPLNTTGQTSATDYLRYAVEATENGDYTGAIVLCDRSIELNNSNELAYYHRAYNRFMLGDFRGTINDTTKAIELNDRLADSFLLRAEAKLKTGERMSAFADYNRARRLDGSITITHFAQNIFKVLF